jgi:putative transposase
MPWQGVTVMEIRRSFVADHRTGAWTMTELCAQYGISRQTGYELLARVRLAGEAGLAPRSRRPHRSPDITSVVIREAVLAAQARFPHWGARPLRQWLIDHYPDVAWPSRSTVDRLRHALPRKPARRRPSVLIARPTRLRPALTPNAVWTIDFKGDFRLGAGYRCYPLTLRDAASRFTLRIDAFAAPDGPITQARLRRAFAEYGLPACLRSDNGPPFAGLGLAGLSQLNVWCLKLGIAIEHIAPGRPDQNGSHEQFHGILKAQTTRPPAHTLRGQQRRFDVFRHEYNYERPHQALGDTVPARHYQPSARGWSGRVPRVDYPGHWEPRRVQLNGRISFAGQSIFLSRALAGEWVALEEGAEDTWTVYFSTVPLARWLTRTQQLRPLRDSGPA